MICEKCGIDMGENKVCSACGWSLEEKTENTIDNNETETDVNSLENLQVDFKEIDNDFESDEVEDEVSLPEDDLVIDFDEINQNTEKKSRKSNSSWLVSFVSFVAGVLATLITIGCFNGTIINYFDRIANGNPTSVVESFCEFYYESESTPEKITEVFSPYLRAQILNELKQRAMYYDIAPEINLEIDVTNDKEFNKVSEYYLSLITEAPTQKLTINNIKFNSIRYFKSGTTEFNTCLAEYRSSSDTNVALAKGVSMFAEVTFDVECTLETYTQTQEETTVATKKNNKKSKKEESTTEQTTQSTTQPITSVESVETLKDECVVICVKINDSWYVFNGMQVVNQ